jgi:flagellar biosynthesis/type III secretory pathway protein FliH
MAALADAELSPGQAMIELGSSRIDVGDGARLALLKSALSLLPRPQPSD